MRELGEDPKTIIVYPALPSAPSCFVELQEQLSSRWKDTNFQTASDLPKLLELVETCQPDLVVLCADDDASHTFKLLREIGKDITRSVPAFIVTPLGDTLFVRLSPWLGDSQLPAADKAQEYFRRRERRKARRRIERYRIERLHEANERYRRLSLEDQLTGLLNRRGFQRFFRLEWARSKRYETALACVAIDLDHFKQINDSFGHSLGDWVLRCFASTLSGASRKSDVVARTGGEEFCVILPNCNEEQATEWAEKLRKLIATTELTAEKRPIRITASFGVASKTEAHRDEQQLLDVADRALMVAKHTGRNRVVASEMLVALRQAIRPPDQGHAIVRSLIESVALRDPELAGHCERVARFASKLASRIGLHENEIWTAEMAGLLHDVGKIGLPDEVLRKPARLSRRERELVNLSMQSSYDIVRSAFGEGPLADAVRASRSWYRDSAPMATKPPVPGQIVAIADAFDAMTTPAPYRKPLTQDEAGAELNRCCGTQFDAKLVQEFLEMVANEA